MYTRTRLFSIGIALVLVSPLAVSAFGFAADMQCTNPQYDYTCQKGSRCPSRKQGGLGTDCVDSGSGVPGTCTAFRRCTDMNDDHRQTSKEELNNATNWGGLGEGANSEGLLSDIGASPDLFDMTNLPEPSFNGPDMGNDIFSNMEGGNPFPDTPFASPDANALGPGDFSQQEGAAGTKTTPGFGQSATGFPFGDVPEPVATPAADSARAVSGPFGDQAALSPSQEGQQGAGQGGGGQGGMSQLPQMGGKGKGGQGGQQSGQPQTGFGQQQNPQDKKPIQQAQDQNLLQRFWDWLSGKTTTT